MTESEIKENLVKIKEKIWECEEKSGRSRNSVVLCAVSKFHPAEDVFACLNAGHKVFGENRVQEAYGKFNDIRSSENLSLNPELHIIGSLQTNKVKKACEIASCIQSVDRLDLVREIQKQCIKLEKKIDVFFEIHTGEESKAGFESISDFKSVLELFSSGEFPNLNAKGLMTMAPFTNDESLIRKSFIQLRELKDQVNKEFPNLLITELSMGMSGDFGIAIEEGSTMVRVGTAIFGERNYQ